jgi:hypothetical protein
MGPTAWVLLCLKTETQLASKTLCFKKLYDGQSAKKENCVQLTSFLLSSLWIP